MRVDVIKYLIMGASKDRDAFFNKVQQLGIVEFIATSSPSLETPAEIQNFIDALRVLRHMVPVKGVPTDDYRSANVLARHIVERNNELEQLYEQSRVLEKEIARVQVFGDFSPLVMQKIEKESGRVFQFFFCKKGTEKESPKREEVIFVGSEYGLDYFIAINKKKRSYHDLIEIVIEKPLGELNEELAEVNREIDIFETELSTLAHYKKALKQGLINILNQYHLEESKDRAQSLIDNQAFAVEGWVAKNKIPLLLKLAEELNIYVEPIQVEKKDRVPTYLENRGMPRLGEDLIGIYDTPSCSDRDPSPWVFFAFALFFSMIVGDAGYGLILLGISLFLLYKFGKKRGLGRRVILLSTYLSVGVIIWGILSASFFGIEFAPDSPFRKASLIDWMVDQKAEYFLEKKPPSYAELIKDYPQLKEAATPEKLLTTVTQDQIGKSKYVVFGNFADNVLIELAIFIGTLHIMLSFLRYLDRNWAGLGWIIFMAGAYLYFPSILGAVSLIHYIFHVPYEQGAFIGKYILFSGLGLVVILAIIQKRLRGIGEILGIIGVFADVMSYLRIYALSLAGAIMATTFDVLGTSVALYIGIFIILAGHLINFVIALMSGIIHGLRLNFIEWYHYSFEGGGKKFNPLSLFKIE
ncbi:MAG: V-type ATP synthase subunit I [Chlamydiales bacterium]